MSCVITGGAGFIGSHLADALENEKVTVFDNFSSGRRDFLKGKCTEIILGDIRNFEETKKACREANVVYHFAADPDVRKSSKDPLENFKIDVLGTINVLEACRLNDVEQIVFASSSVVYGNAKTPTPENASIAPVSNYGAAKAASEYYVSTYSQLYGINATVLRYANIVGPRLTHGVIYDFFHKLKRNSKKLEILGDGNQKKSYLHVYDSVNVTLLAVNKSKKKFDVFNVGSEEQINVRDIACLVVSQIGLKDVEYEYTGGRTGWPGDVPVMLLSIEKLKSLGWKPRFTIEKSVLDTVDWLRKHPTNNR